MKSGSSCIGANERKRVIWAGARCRIYCGAKAWVKEHPGTGCSAIDLKQLFTGSSFIVSGSASGKQKFRSQKEIRSSGVC